MGEGGRVVRRLRQRALIVAGILSFAVYLLPIMTPHAIYMLGPAIFRMMAMDEGAADSSLQILAALALQAVLFGALYFFLRRISVLRGLLLIVCLPILAFSAEVTFLLAIPALAQVDFDVTPDQGDWPLACQVENASLVQIFHNTSLELEQAGEAWLRRPGADPAETRFAVLTMPDCQIRERLSGRGFQFSSRDGYAPGGAVLYWTSGQSGADPELRLLAPDQAEPRRIETPEGERGWAPILSSDGRAIAWPTRLEDGTSGIRIMDLDREARRFVPVEPVPGQWLELLAFDQESGRLVLRSRPNEAVEIDLDGQVVRGPLLLDPPLEASFGLRWLADGWVASSFPLNASEAVQVGWQLGAGDGRHRLPKGRSLTSLSVDSSGRYIALSIDQSVNLFALESAVYVLDSRDGREVFRRALPPYSRASVAFLGERHLAIDRLKDGVPLVEVLSLPGQRLSAQ